MRATAIALVLALAGLAAHAALGPRYGGTLDVGVLELPPDLGPRRPLGPGARLVSAMVNATLVEVGADGALQPALAAGWGSAEGGREWTLRLDPAARFHDNTPVTAGDVVSSLRRFLRSPSVAAAEMASRLEGGTAFRAGRLDELPGLAALEDRRVRLRLREPVLDPLLPLASPAAAIISPSGRGAGPFRPIDGAGPSLRLRPFVGHVRGRPYLDAVELQAFGDTVRLEEAQQAGQVDALPGVTGRPGPAPHCCCSSIRRARPSRAPRPGPPSIGRSIAASSCGTCCPARTPRPTSSCRGCSRPSAVPASAPRSARSADR